jgi:type I restriction enzyme R subunit
VYVYSLKDGINDGFLTPFRYKEVSTTGDEYTYTEGDVVMEGELEYGRTYTQEEQNRIIEIMDVERYRVKVLLQSINQNQKTIVFCEDQRHALAIRNLINQLSDSSNPNYCHRVTADDGKLGEQHLNEFQDNQRSIPTILTTSQKLSTGVDAPEVRNVVLMRVVHSMVEFKQIIGRGTRLYDGKDYFTVYDFFWKLHTHFEDPEWDGPPEEPPAPVPPSEPCLECGRVRCICKKEPTELCELCGKAPCECNAGPTRTKVVVRLGDGTARSLQHMTKTRFWSKEGRPISADAFVQQLFGDLPSLFKDEAALRRIWSMPGTRKKLLEEMEEKGYTQAQLYDLQDLVEGRDSDLFDVLSYVAYHRDLVPRTTRADRAKVHFNSYDPKQQEFLNFVLEQYVKSGVDELDDQKLPELLELKYTAVADAKAQLGPIPTIRETFIGFQKWLYGEVG